jgi:hypothetical protein
MRHLHSRARPDFPRHHPQTLTVALNIRLSETIRRCLGKPCCKRIAGCIAGGLHNDCLWKDHAFAVNIAQAQFMGDLSQDTNHP